MSREGNIHQWGWGLLCVAVAGGCAGKAENAPSDDGSGGRDSPVLGEGGDPLRGGGDTGGLPGDGDRDTGGMPGNDHDGAGGASVGGAGGASSASDLPCDIFEARGHPCVAAHSTVRVLRQAYEGPLYEVSNSSDQTLDIGATDAGYADAALQDNFCATVSCTVTTIYDQSGRGNHLEPAPPGGAKPTPGLPASASALPTTINGTDTYGLRLRPAEGYRAGCSGCTVDEGSGIPVGDEPETIYMVTSSADLINGCCFNYGNGSLSGENEGSGTAETVYFGMGVIWGTGTGPGPWVMTDLENGIFPGWENGGYNNISSNSSLDHAFVTAFMVGDTAEKNDGQGRFALYGASAQDRTLSTMYDGIRPERPGYVPMQKEGSLILGVGSDNSNGGGGRFYEAALVSGAASKETLDAVQASIAAAGYESSKAE